MDQIGGRLGSGVQATLQLQGPAKSGANLARRHGFGKRAAALRWSGGSRRKAQATLARLVLLLTLLGWSARSDCRAVLADDRRYEPVRDWLLESVRSLRSPDRRGRHQGNRVRLAGRHAPLPVAWRRTLGSSEPYLQGRHRQGDRAGNSTQERGGAMTNPHIGSSFDDFLAEEGILEEVEAVAIKRIIGPPDRRGDEGAEPDEEGHGLAHGHQPLGARSPARTGEHLGDLANVAEGRIHRWPPAATRVGVACDDRRSPEPEPGAEPGATIRPFVRYGWWRCC